MGTQQTELIDEAELTFQLQKRKHTALAYLYGHYAPALYGVILRIVKREEIADEVLQDSFLKIWEKIHDYDPQKGRLFTWMHKIARNLAIDQRRSKACSQMSKTR